MKDYTNRIVAALPLDQLFIWLTQTGFGLRTPPTISACFQFGGAMGVAEREKPEDLASRFLASSRTADTFAGQEKFSRGEKKTREKNKTKTLPPVTPRFVNGALLLFSLNGLHFTLPCILATAIAASFQSCINHCGENVWEICAVRSVPVMSPVSLFMSVKVFRIFPRSNIY